jgi:hypothetical protein
MKYGLDLKPAEPIRGRPEAALDFLSLGARRAADNLPWRHEHGQR